MVPSALDLHPGAWHDSGMDWFRNADKPPRPAAAAILYRGSFPVEVLLARRNPKLRFMGGHHVFPGGSVDDADLPGFVAHCADAAAGRRILTAAREVFEETGLLLTRGTLPDREAARAARRALHAGTHAFPDILRDFGLRLDARDFTPAGVWITPPFSPIRFDTQYYLVACKSPAWEEAAEEPEPEILSLDWFEPGAARAAWQREEIKLSTPVAFVLRHLAALPPDEALPLLRDTPGRDVMWTNRYEPRRGIHIIPVRTGTLPPAEHTNCVVIGERELAIVDPGASGPDEQAYLLGHLGQLLALGGRVRAILLTHGHGDHAGAVARLRELYNAPVLAHPDSGAPCVDETLEEGAVLELEGEPGWRIRCLHTPGHHPGHLCFLEENTATLLCGDMIANPGSVVIAPAYGGDMAAYLASLERLTGEPFHFLVPGHGLPSWGGKDNGKELLRTALEHRREREEKILAALDAGATSIQDVLEAAYTDVDRKLWPLAAMQIDAHLRALGRTLP